MRRMKSAERPAETEYDFGVPPSDEERERLMDPGYWDWDAPVEAAEIKNAGLRLTIRLEGDDVKAIGAAARLADMPMDEFIKWAALLIANVTSRLPRPTR